MSEPEASERGSSLIGKKLHYRGIQSLFLTKRKELWLCATQRFGMCKEFHFISFRYTSSSLYVYTSDTFRPILAFFTHFTLHQFSLTYITTRNIFLIPGDAVAQNLIIVYNFSSQRTHLNYLFLSNVYSFDTIEFSMKHKY